MNDAQEMTERQAAAGAGRSRSLRLRPRAAGHGSCGRSRTPSGASPSALGGASATSATGSGASSSGRSGPPRTLGGPGRVARRRRRRRARRRRRRRRAGRQHQGLDRDVRADHGRRRSARRPVEQRSGAGRRRRPNRPCTARPRSSPRRRPSRRRSRSPTEPAQSSTEPAAPHRRGSDRLGQRSGRDRKISSFPTASRPTAAEAATIPGPPAGAEAIAVARDFSGAFVVYETGGESSEVRKAFAETATPELAKALLKRPPRLPANVEVPKAKVLNVVPAPRAAASTRSASRCCGSA